MNLSAATQHTLIGRAARKLGVRLNIYILYLLLLNAGALFLAVSDAKGLVVLVLTLGASLALHLQHSLREEQRLTNELLEELLERAGPLR